MWKDYFFYTKSERIATLTLIVIISLLLVLKIYLSSNTNNSSEKLTKEEINKIQNFEKVAKPTSRIIIPAKIDSTTLKQLGLKSSTIHQLIKEKRLKNDAEYYNLFIETIKKEKPELINQIIKQK